MRKNTIKNPTVIKRKPKAEPFDLSAPDIDTEYVEPLVEDPDYEVFMEGMNEYLDEYYAKWKKDTLATALQLIEEGDRENAEEAKQRKNRKAASVAKASGAAKKAARTRRLKRAASEQKASAAAKKAARTRRANALRLQRP